ncbi:MAG: hypothetical protein L0Y42_01810 [Phycisphaerales bacterium]|nr:hypothetical protein [Phycisphaerales bacterium]
MLCGKPQLMFIGLALAALTSTSCSNTKEVSKANNELRMKNVELQSQVDDLSRRNKELQIELERSSAVPSTLPEDIRANTPHVTAIKIDGISHVRDSDNDGRPDRLVIYLQPTDGRGRFTQLVGSVSVNAALVPADGEAQTVGRVTLNPAEVRDAYRSTITGIHYTIEVPIQLPDLPAGKGDQKLVASVAYDDGATGQRLTAERAINLK